jgi:hypothetical protein
LFEKQSSFGVKNNQAVAYVEVDYNLIKPDKLGRSFSLYDKQNIE